MREAIAFGGAARVGGLDGRSRLRLRYDDHEQEAKRS
jgi:hypothetical protein